MRAFSLALATRTGSATGASPLFWFPWCCPSRGSQIAMRLFWSTHVLACCLLDIHAAQQHGVGLPWSFRTCFGPSPCVGCQEERKPQILIAFQYRPMRCTPSVVVVPRWIQPVGSRIVFVVWVHLPAACLAMSSQFLGKWLPEWVDLGG